MLFSSFASFVCFFDVNSFSISFLVFIVCWLRGFGFNFFFFSSFLSELEKSSGSFVDGIN